MSKREMKQRNAYNYRIRETGEDSCALCRWSHERDITIGTETFCTALEMKVDHIHVCIAWRARAPVEEAQP